MTRLEDRTTLIAHITEARAGGARLAQACALVGIDPRTIQHWRKHDGLTRGDRRPDAVRPTPSHALTAEERARIVAVANEPRFAETPPARIVPMLADEGTYIASESSFHRVLRAHGQMHRCGRAKPPRSSRPPTTHVATAPGQVWCWDITFLPAMVKGQWFYLYLILDLYSRKIVGLEVHGSDSADHAVDLVRRTALNEGLHALAAKPVLHGDNGATLKASSVLAMLNWLGIAPSHSRPRVSNDNPYAEALFEPPNTARSSPNAASPIATKLATGPRASCIGTITCIVTARSATSHQPNVMTGRTMRSSPRATTSISARNDKHRRAGANGPGNGRRSPRSRSIPSVARQFRRRRQQIRFPVRLARCLDPLRGSSVPA